MDNVGGPSEGEKKRAPRLIRYHVIDMDTRPTAIQVGVYFEIVYTYYLIT